jgi:hypothetical protein
MTNITIPPKALEAAARSAVLFNGGDPDKKLRQTLHRKTIAQWEQVAPVIEAACLAMLEAWPGMQMKWSEQFFETGRSGTPAIILPLTESNDD